MSVATSYARAEFGIDAPLVTVEAAVSAGLPQTLIVGLPATAVRESKDRVKAAVTSSGMSYPSDRKLTINLAPADLPKTSGRYDLAIAIAVLAASGHISQEAAASWEFLGELSLTGELRAVKGVLPAALRNRDSTRLMVVPAANATEAALAQSGKLYAANTLTDVVNLLVNGTALPLAIGNRTAKRLPWSMPRNRSNTEDHSSENIPPRQATICWMPGSPRRT